MAPTAKREPACGPGRSVQPERLNPLVEAAGVDDRRKAPKPNRRFGEAPQPGAIERRPTITQASAERLKPLNEAAGIDRAKRRTEGSRCPADSRRLRPFGQSPNGGGGGN